MSCTINVPVSIIAAASHAMAKQDIRYYLNGMMIERSEHGGVRVVATDGQHLIAARANDASIKQRKIQQYILPRDFILAIVKSAEECNAEAFYVFESMATQWRIGMAGATGLDYAAMPVVMDMVGVARKRRPEVFESVRIMETEALATMAENREDG